MAKIAQKASLSKTKKTDNSVQILGVAVTGTQKDRVLSKIKLQRKNLFHIATVNPEFVMEARRSRQFAQVLARCDLTVADGWGIVWGVRLTTGREIARISGVEMVDSILDHANSQHKKVFLLGARAGVAQLAAKNIASQYPALEIAWYAGARSVAVEASEEASMTIAKINAFEPDYLLVAYGSPWQDIWIEENRQYLRVGLAMGVGGTLDEIAGVVPRCPNWLDRMGLKWLFRLMTQPWRARRILRVVQFGGLVIMQMVKEKIYKLID